MGLNHQSVVPNQDVNIQCFGYSEKFQCQPFSKYARKFETAVTVTAGAGPFRPGSMAAAFDLTMILCPESLSRFFLVVLSPADPLIGASAPAVSVGPL